MPLQHFWVGGSGVDDNSVVGGPPDPAIFITGSSLVIPAGARLLKVVASCGMAGYATYNLDLHPEAPIGYPAAWTSNISFSEGPSTAFPFGRVVVLNEQSGEYSRSMAVYPPQDSTVDGTTNPLTHQSGKLTTAYMAHMDHVDQSMSYGTVHEDIGVRNIGFEFRTWGLNFTDGALTPFFIRTTTFKVLCEVMA